MITACILLGQGDITCTVETNKMNFIQISEPLRIGEKVENLHRIVCHVSIGMGKELAHKILKDLLNRIEAREYCDNIWINEIMFDMRFATESVLKVMVSWFESFVNQENSEKLE